MNFVSSVSRKYFKKKDKYCVITLTFQAILMIGLKFKKKKKPSAHHCSPRQYRVLIQRNDIFDIFKQKNHLISPSFGLKIV
jgi:hypothetical protein